MIDFNTLNNDDWSDEQIEIVKKYKKLLSLQETEVKKLSIRAACHFTELTPRPDL